MSRSKLASVAAGLVVGAAALAVPAPPAGANGQAQAADVSIAGASPTAGGFGLPAGSIQSSAQTSASADGGYDSIGNCAGYATNVGVGIYCYSDETGGITPPDLIEQFPDRDYHECRYYDIPEGMKAPRNQPGKGQYYLRACITDIDWFHPFGGDPRLVLQFYFVGEDEPDPTDWDPTPLDEYLWNQVSSNYPTPFATNWPFKLPRVNAPTWFQFRWLDENLETAAQGPYEDNVDGGPYLEIQSGDVTLTAEAVGVRLAPQILDADGGGLMDEVDCSLPLKDYDEGAGPYVDEQASDCYVVFEHSSAAAEELTPDDVPLPEPDPSYPIPMYVINIEVDWLVTMETDDGETVSLGEHEFVAYQALPVSEVSGLTGVES